MVNNALNRILHWLAAHTPRILSESLNPGAAEAQLAALEATIGQHLPADYRALNLHHDGMNEDAENFGNFCYPAARGGGGHLAAPSQGCRARTGALEQGHYSLEPDALADVDEYLSLYADIDLDNWSTAVRWATFRA